MLTPWLSTGDGCRLNPRTGGSGAGQARAATAAVSSAVTPAKAKLNSVPPTLDEPAGQQAADRREPGEREEVEAEHPPT